MCTCPFHANGKEHNPSCGVLLQQKVTKDKTYEAGTVHCYTCGYTADLPQFVADLLGLSSPVEGFKWLIQTTDVHYVGETIGISLDPDAIHIMKKSSYSEQFGDYSSYSAEYDEMEEDPEGEGDEE